MRRVVGSGQVCGIHSDDPGYHASVHARRLVTALAIVGTIAHHAHADDKATCIAASENAQKLKDAQQLLAARDAFSQCSREVCPAVLRKDCGENFEALDKKLVPTIVIRARDAAGNDVVSASVKIDEIASALDGTPVAVDPGRHKIRVTAADDTKVVDILAAQGERDRVVVVTLDGKPKTAVAPTGAAPTPAEQPASGGSVVQRVIGVGVIGVGVVSLGFGVYFLLGAMGESSDFDKEGSGLKTCSFDASGNQTSVNATNLQPCHVTDSSGLTHADRANRYYVMTGVSTLIGVALATVGTVLVATSFGSKPKASAQVLPIITPTQAGVGLVGSF